MEKKKINKIYLGGSLPAKLAIILLLGLFTKPFFGCTSPPPPPPIEMQYNSIRIVGIDNSGRFLKSHTHVDTMYYGAVAFKLTLMDSTINYYALNSNKGLKSLLFTPVMALSFDQIFVPVDIVEQITITTLFDVDENIRAGADITNLFVYETGSNFELYQNMNNAISALNRVQRTASSSIVLVLKISVQNTMAQFNFQVSLDNGKVLSYDTDIFTIKTQ